MKISKTTSKSVLHTSLFILFMLLVLGNSNMLTAQNGAADLARYTPEWIRDGFADAGATHEPWIFQVRRNNGKFSHRQKELYDYQTTEEYIKALAEAGITVYHLYCYKGFGFEAEKAHMEQAAKAAAIAHKYGMKVDTYIQWNTMAYETFFAEVPEAKDDLWYQIDVNGKPILLTYSYQQSFRYRPCFNHDAYMEYFKEKIIRYAVEEIKTDFIHFDNFDFNYPPEADFNPATIAAFRKYLEDKYSPEARLERFGFDNLSYIQPPMWNEPNPAEKMLVINDPVIQEWVDFRCWTFTTRLAECARFARALNKEIAIEVNPHGLVGSNRAWEAGINHPDLMQYTNVIWTEDSNNPRWENGVSIGKFRHYKLGRTTHNFIMTGNHKEQDFAENLALNRTIGSLGRSLPEGVRKKYLDFWLDHKDLYTGMCGGEKVAVLRSYPSMAYNIIETQVAVNMAEQVLQQRQIPFDIIFDEQMENLGKYDVLVLANQESLSDFSIEKIKSFVKDGGGIVATGHTGMYDQWRRLRPHSLTEDMLLETEGNVEAEEDANAKPEPENENVRAFTYGDGRVMYLPGLEAPKEEIKLGFESVWFMPENANELESAVFWAAGKTLPLTVSGPEWLGVSHDKQKGRDVIHLFNYHDQRNVGGITIQFKGGVKKAWIVSPDQDGIKEISVAREGEMSVIRITDLKVYKVLVLEH